MKNYFILIIILALISCANAPVECIEVCKPNGVYEATQDPFKVDCICDLGQRSSRYYR